MMTEAEIRKEFGQRLISDYKDCLEEWKNMTPNDLIDNADLISATQLVRDNAENLATPSEMGYLLRFKHPLEVLRDAWIYENGRSTVHDDEFRHMMWNCVMNGDAE